MIQKQRVVVGGAGPAGLTAAYKLGCRGIEVRVVEKERTVGGISKTILHRGYRFDVGGHRFFTKVSRSLKHAKFPTPNFQMNLKSERPISKLG